MNRKTTSQRLAELIEMVGFRDVVLRPARGAWRTDVRLDVYRWEGIGVTRGHVSLPDGMDVSFASWDTMTDCLKHGIFVDKGDAGIATDFLVHLATSETVRAIFRKGAER